MISFILLLQQLVVPRTVGCVICWNPAKTDDGPLLMWRLSSWHVTYSVQCGDQKRKRREAEMLALSLPWQPLQKVGISLLRKKQCKGLFQNSESQLVIGLHWSLHRESSASPSISGTPLLQNYRRMKVNFNKAASPIIFFLSDLSISSSVAFWRGSLHTELPNPHLHTCRITKLDKTNNAIIRPNNKKCSLRRTYIDGLFEKFAILVHLCNLFIRSVVNSNRKEVCLPLTTSLTSMFDRRLLVVLLE